MAIKIFSFFSGAGFLDLGFERAGFDVVFVNEYNPSFLEIYKYAREKMNMPLPQHGYSNKSIEDYLYKDKKLELKNMVQKAKKDSLVGFIGGPPCPDFSIGGKNRGATGANGRLTEVYKRIIMYQMPDFFLFENVKGLLSTKKHLEYYSKFKKSLERKGYVLTDKIVNALLYGVPQDRERIILLGVRKDYFNDIQTKEKFKNCFDWGFVIKKNIADIKNMNWPLTNVFEENGERIQPKHILEELTVEHWFHRNDVTNHINAKDYFHPQEGNDRFNSIEEGDVSKKSYKRLHRWRYSPTVAYGNNEVHLHPYKPRRISVSEALALQSLPIDFIIKPTENLTCKFKAIGNGVPFLMAYNIAERLRAFLEAMVQKDDENS